MWLSNWASLSLCYYLYVLFFFKQKTAYELRISDWISDVCSSDLVESFNGRLRDECLNETLFVSLGHARSVLRLWRDDYNHVRPHSGVGGLTPADAARRVVQHRPEGHHTNPGLQL